MLKCIADMQTKCFQNK